MDFAIKAMQLSIERYISGPQDRGDDPSRIAVFLDLKNMFNNISREELRDIVDECFPELVPLVDLLYDTNGEVSFRWEDGSWRRITMIEGANQGCPLSAIFAALVLDRVIRPIDGQLKARAAARLADGDKGDDNHGSVANLFGYVDDVATAVCYDDYDFLHQAFDEEGNARGCHQNGFKTRALTSCNGVSILPTLRVTQPAMARRIEATLDTYSVKKDPNSPTGTARVELTDGFRHLGTPVGSAKFANEFFDQQVNEVR